MHAVRSYEACVAWVVSLCPGPDKFAHICAGLAIWLAAMLLWRHHRSLLPLLVVIVAETLNECVDRVAHGSWMWRDTLGDVAATLLWPLILTLWLRHTLPVARRAALAIPRTSPRSAVAPAVREAERARSLLPS